MLGTGSRRLERLRPSGLRSHRLSRPSAIVEGTRWLFWLLSMISLVLVVVPILGSQTRFPLLLGAVATLAALAASLTAGYLTGRQHWLWDVVDALLLLVAAAISPSPPIFVGFLMALIWFRTLYGSTRAAFVRAVLLGSGLLLGGLLWEYVPGHPLQFDVVEMVFVLPTMLLTTAAGRHLAGILAERESAAACDAIHAAAGSRLLGVTDPDEILRIAWHTTTELCASTPGLRVLNVVSDGVEPKVTGHAGDFAAVPAALPLAVIDTPAHDGSAEPSTTTLPQLDAAAGATCAWRCASLMGQRDGAWLVIGSTPRVPAHALDTLTGFVMQVILALRSSAAHRKLTVQATMDSLTGLANRSLFNLSLASALSGSSDSASSCDTAVLFVDLDDFKDVNDVLGHATGDELLREVSARLVAATRPQDVCARLGGDEFAVLMYRTGADTALEVGHRIVMAVSEPVHLTEGVAHVGASVGVAVCSGDASPEQLVQRADVAMYAAKAAGKGRVQLFADGLLRNESAEHVFDAELLAAAHEGQLFVEYQPVVSLADERCTAVEALVRWTHPTRGLLQPRDFIAAAERNGAIREIGSFVLRRACADAAAWRTSRPLLPVHVNVSPLQLDAAFCADVLGCLEEFALPAEQLVLEVTETIVLASQEAIGHLEALAERGVLIAVGDFGTGYAALTTLRSLPVSIVKIDASFVAGSTVNRADRAVVEAIVQLAGRLGLQTIAEGVERPEQQALFAALGATSAQGFLFLRPTSPAEISAWLDGREPAAREGQVVAFPERRGPTAG